MIHDPTSQLVRSILFIYSLETQIPLAINVAQRDKNAVKVESLGPFCLILRSIIYGAQEERIDKDRSYGDKVVWRAAILNQSTLIEYNKIFKNK